VIRIPGAPAGRGGYKRMEYNDSYPPASVIHMSFPERGEMPPVKLHWYDGGILPERPDDLEPERNLPESGTIFVGDKGKMWCETYSESPRLIPESAMTAFTPRPPRTLPRVPEGRNGHEKNWLDAIRTHGQATSNFDYAGPFTEVVLLGNVALRFPGQRLMWDGAGVVFGKTFLFHPPDARERVLALADAATDAGTPAAEFLFRLSRLYVRWHRLGHLGAAKIYSGDA